MDQQQLELMQKRVDAVIKSLLDKISRLEYQLSVNEVEMAELVEVNKVLNEEIAKMKEEKETKKKK